MSYPETGGEPIPLADAVAMTKAWRDADLSKLTDLNQTHALYFSNDLLQSIMRQGTVGIRFYLGLKKEGFTGAMQLELVCCGVDSSGNDLASTSTIIGDMAVKCPPQCSTESPLNQ